MRWHASCTVKAEIILESSFWVWPWWDPQDCKWPFLCLDLFHCSPETVHLASDCQHRAALYNIIVKDGRRKQKHDNFEISFKTYPSSHSFCYVNEINDKNGVLWMQVRFSICPAVKCELMSDLQPLHSFVQCSVHWRFFYCKDGERFPGQAEVKRLCKDPINQQQVLQHFAPLDYTLRCIAFEADISE